MCSSACKCKLLGNNLNGLLAVHQFCLHVCTSKRATRTRSWSNRAHALARSRVPHRCQPCIMQVGLHSLWHRMLQSVQDGTSMQANGCHAIGWRSLTARPGFGPLLCPRACPNGPSLMASRKQSCIPPNWVHTGWRLVHSQHQAPALCHHRSVKAPEFKGGGVQAVPCSGCPWCRSEVERHAQEGPPPGCSPPIHASSCARHRVVGTF